MNILYWVSNEQTLNFEHTSTNHCLLAQNCLLNPFRWCVLDIIINIKQNWITYENILFELTYSNRKLQMGTFIYIVCILGRLDNLWSSCKPVFSTAKCQRVLSNTSNIFHEFELSESFFGNSILNSWQPWLERHSLEMNL